MSTTETQYSNKQGGEADLISLYNLESFVSVLSGSNFQGRYVQTPTVYKALHLDGETLLIIIGLQDWGYGSVSEVHVTKHGDKSLHL